MKFSRAFRLAPLADAVVLPGMFAGIPVAEAFGESGRLVVWAMLMVVFFAVHFRHLSAIYNAVPGLMRWAAVFYLFLNLVSLGWCTDKWSGIAECGRILLLILWIHACAFLYRRKQPDFLPFVLALGFLMGILLIIEFRQLPLALRTTGNYYFPPGLWGNSNLFGEVAALLIPLVVLFVGRSAAGLVAGFFFLSVASVIIFFSHCQAAVISWFLFGAVVWLMGGIGLRISGYRKWWVNPWLILLVLVSVGVFIGWNNIQGNKGWTNYFRRNLETSTSQDLPQLGGGLSSAQERIILWRHTLKLIGEKPILGHGAGSWVVLISQRELKYVNCGPGCRYFAAPHNDFLWAWAEVGLPGMLTWGVFLFAGFYFAWKILFSKVQIREKWIAACCLGGFCTWLVFSIFAYPRGMVFHLVLLGTLMGFTASIFQSLRQTRN